MIRQIILLIIAMWSFDSNGQSKDNVEGNIIILLNDELEVGMLFNFQLTQGKKNTSEKYEIDYVPGNLVISRKNYQAVLDVEDSIFITFDHSIFKGQKQEVFNYKIPFNPLWLEYEFLILRVYDTGRGRFRNVFEPLSRDKNYTFELDYPGGSLKRIKIDREKK